MTSISPFARVYVLPLLPEFSRLYPRIDVELHLDDRVADMIAEGYDVGIRAGGMREASMVVREIAPLHFVICGAPDYFAGRGVPAKAADLAKYNCLRLRGRGSQGARPSNWRLGPKEVPAAPPVSGNFIGGDITTLVAAATHGQGLVFAPLPFVLPLFRSGALAPVLPEYISQPGKLFIYYPNRRHLPVRVRSFANFLLERLRKNLDLGPDAQSLVAPYLPVRKRAALA